MHWHFPIFCLSQQNIVFLLKILSSGYSYISIGLHFPTECQEVSLSRVISLSFYPFFSLSFLSPSPSLFLHTLPLSLPSLSLSHSGYFSRPSRLLDCLLRSLMFSAKSMLMIMKCACRITHLPQNLSGKEEVNVLIHK